MTLTEPEVNVAGSDDDVSPTLRTVPTCDHLDSAPAGFTWERSKHAPSDHRPGPVVALTAQAKKLAFCKDCNLLLELKPDAQKLYPPRAATSDEKKV
jgi:hypothetical protein